MAKKTKPRSAASRRAKRHGEISIGTIIAFILGLIVLIILAILLNRGGGTVSPLQSKVNLLSKDSSCYLGAGLRAQASCSASETDWDGDCLKDSCDFCVDRTKPMPKAPDANYIEELRAAGSNLLDADSDALPDMCDPEPLNPNVNSCTINPGTDKCKIPSKYIGEGGTQIQLASLSDKPADPTQAYTIG